MIILALALSLIGALLQVSLFPALGLWGGPDLLAVIIAALLLRAGLIPALVAALIGGVLLDSVSTLTYGIMSVTYLLAALSGHSLRGRLNLADRLPHLLVMLLVVGVVSISLLILAMLLSGEATEALGGELRRGVSALAVTLLAGALLFSPLRSLQRFAALYQGQMR